MSRQKRNATEDKRDLRVWVKPETFQRLDEIAEKTNRTRATTIDYAIAILYEQELGKNDLL